MGKKHKKHLKADKDSTRDDAEGRVVGDVTVLSAWKPANIDRCLL